LNSLSEFSKECRSSIGNFGEGSPKIENLRVFSNNLILVFGNNAYLGRLSKKAYNFNPTLE
jgi:hypothetical protein